MLDALAEAAWKRPWVPLGAAAALLAIAMAIALGAPERLALGSFETEPDAPAPPDLIVAIEGGLAGSPTGEHQAYRAVIAAASARIEADPDAGEVRAHRPRGPAELTVLTAELEPDGQAERERALERLEAAIDPGQLRAVVGGEAKVVADARDVLAEDLWRLELLVLPLALLVIVATFRVGLAAAPLLAAATAIAAALAGLRIADPLTEISVVGAAPAAATGLALGIEFPAVLAARFHDELETGTPRDAVDACVADGGRVIALAAAAAMLAPLGLLVTQLDQAASIAIGCAVAALAALACAMLTVPALAALAHREGRGSPWLVQPGSEGLLVRIVRIVPRWLAGSRLRALAAAVIAVAALAALIALAFDGQTKAFEPAELPRDSEAREATELAERAGLADAGRGGDALFADLPLAAALSGLLLALVFAGAWRSPRRGPAAVVALLPAAAACGVIVFAFGDGGIAELIGTRAHQALDTGAVAALVSAVAAVCAARCALALDAIREERAFDPAAAGMAERAAATTLPAAVAATLVAGGACGVLAATQLDAAREFGVGVAVGLLLDLLVVRSVMLAALARWAK